MDERLEKGLNDMLLPYVQKAVRDNPRNFISHAAEYFTKLRDERKTGETKIEEGSKKYIEKVLGTRAVRRGTIMGEKYNPEEDDDTDDIEIVPKSDEQRERIKSQCEDIFLFRVLDKTDLNAVIDAMTPKSVKEGDVIIKQGDDGDYFYLIDKGEFNAYIIDPEGNDRLVMTYKDRGFFGELALLHNQPRAATVKAASEGLLWAVSRKTFNKLIVKRAFEKRQLYMQLLEGVPQLKPLTEYEKMQIADALRGKSYSQGEIIVREGDEGDGMYFIVEGKVSVRQKEDSYENVPYKEVNQLGSGEYFGGKFCFRSYLSVIFISS